MENEEKNEPEYIDGFEKAEYEKFNSYASENGLEGTLIYIEGKVLNQTKIGDNSEIPMLGLVVEQNDGNRWCASIISDSEVEGITDKNVRIFGTYQGFSDVMNLPGLSVVVEDAELMDKARIEVVENENWVEVWNFYNNYAKTELDKLNSDFDDLPSENEAESVDKEEVKQAENQEEIEMTNTPTTGQRNALKSAKDYLSFSAFSYEGLIKQLEYEQYSHEDAVYAADNCGADWNEQAAKSAKSYLDFSSFSKDRLIEQLEYEGFTHEQAVYGAEQNGY